MSARYDVFISHSTEDKPVADGACHALESRGIRCWISSRDLHPGQEWMDEIPRALSSVRVVVLILSSSANSSWHVSREVQMAVESGRAIIPLRIEDIRPRGALEYCIGQTHWLDALTPPLERHLEILAEKVAGLIDVERHPILAGIGREEEARESRRKRKLGLWIAIGAVVIIAAAGSVWLLDQRSIPSATVTEVQPKIYPAEEIYEQANTAWLNGDHKEAFRLSRIAADQGNPSAQYLLGFMYGNGIGVEMNEQAALRLYQSSADLGNADAQAILGFIYLLGLGGSVDPIKAAEYHRKAAGQGHADAQAWMGFQYYFGSGVPKDWEEAYRWFEMSARKGSGYGQFWLAYLYYKGQVVSIDYGEALRWCQMSADQGMRDAEWLMGLMYAEGLALPKDLKKAAEWYRKSADQGKPESQFELGRLYETSEGVERDIDQAVQWYRLAAEQNSQPAKDALTRLGR
jgi:TPR repeat protein